MPATDLLRVVTAAQVCESSAPPANIWTPDHGSNNKAVKLRNYQPNSALPAVDRLP